MKIYFDNIIFSLQKSGGISIYWSELLSRMLRDGYISGIIEGKDEKNIFKDNIHIPKDLILTKNTLPIVIRRFLPELKLMPRNSIFHSSYYRYPIYNNYKVIQTVHDFTYEKFGSGPSKFLHSIQKRAAINNADGIICVSNNTKKDLLQQFPNILVDKVTVINHGYSNEYKIINKLDVNINNFNKFKSFHNRPYLVYVGDRRSKYKNFQVIIEVMSYALDYGIIIVGGGELNESERRILNSKVSLRYLHLDNLSKVELNIIYNFAHALIYPSAYEGFGIPLLEAMAAGCPVVAVNTSAIPEVIGDAGLLVSYPEVNLFLEAIIKLENQFFRNSIIKKGLNNIKRFSWEQCYQDTINFYKFIYHK